MADHSSVDAVFTGGLTYDVDGDRRLLLDVLRPVASATVPRPLVLFLHGGGWHEGDRGAGMHPWLNPLLVSHGFVAAGLTYRLSGEAHWPDLRGERLDSGNEVARLMGPDAGPDALSAASPVCHVHPGGAALPAGSRVPRRGRAHRAEPGLPRRAHRSRGGRPLGADRGRTS